jgi:hypothetical protein
MLWVIWLADDDCWINVFGFSKLFTCRFQVGYFAHNDFRITYARSRLVLDQLALATVETILENYGKPRKQLRIHIHQQLTKAQYRY